MLLEEVTINLSNYTRWLKLERHYPVLKYQPNVQQMTHIHQGGKLEIIYNQWLIKKSMLTQELFASCSRIAKKGFKDSKGGIFSHF